MEDPELLRQFAESRSERAFSELVRRHLKLVYCSSLRHVNGDAHRAEEVTQNVFIDLARKASSLANRSTITGWLYTSTRFAAAAVMRADRRRRKHELNAHIMQEALNENAAEIGWRQVEPVIDEALHELTKHEREAILLRFFEDLSFSQVGDVLKISENAARMRVDRAMDKLHGILLQRGITSTAAALSGVLAASQAFALPVEIEGSVVYAAVTSAGEAATAAAGAKMLTMAKVALGLAAAAALVTAVWIKSARHTAEAYPAPDRLAPSAKMANAAMTPVEMRQVQDSEVAGSAIDSKSKPPNLPPVLADGARAKAAVEFITRIFKRGDFTIVAQHIDFEPAARAQAESLYRNLSVATQEKFVLQNVAQAVAFGFVLGQVPKKTQVISSYSSGPSDATFQVRFDYADGHRTEQPVHLRYAQNGWHWILTEGDIVAAERELPHD